MTEALPWGLTHLSPFPSSPGPHYTLTGLNPETQQAIYVGPEGQPIKAGKHGTNKETKTVQKTGGDGANPRPSDEITMIDYSDD